MIHNCIGCHTYRIVLITHGTVTVISDHFSTIEQQKISILDKIYEFYPNEKEILILKSIFQNFNQLNIILL